jgi:hypothetical protein
MAMPRNRRPSAAAGSEEFRFKIDAYTPATMPMARLAEYMSELAQLLGEPTAVHFKRVGKGSTVLIQTIDREAVPKVRERTIAVRQGDGPQEAVRAFRTLNKFLRDDNATGVLREARPRGIVLRFPGRLEPDEKYASIRQFGTIDGVINRMGGRDETIHVSLEMDGKQISGCYTTRAIAKELRHFMFDPVRLSGRGRWNRDTDGNWTLEDFRIESFEALKDVPLSDALRELRAIRIDWDDNAINELGEIRHGPGNKRNGGH